jgi:RNA polymerase sigma-70 factor (ECF subfamily)
VPREERTQVFDGADRFREIFNDHRESVYRLLYRLARNPHDAEDLLQETFTRLWKKQSQYRGGSLQAYLRKIAYRSYLNARPRLVRGRALAPISADLPAGGRCPAGRLEHDDLERYLLERVQLVVDGLPDAWREPFVLYRYEGLTCREVAEMTGLSTKAVEMRVTKALKRIAARLHDLRAEYQPR